MGKQVHVRNWESCPYFKVSLFSLNWHVRQNFNQLSFSSCHWQRCSENYFCNYLFFLSFVFLFSVYAFVNFCSVPVFFVISYKCTNNDQFRRIFIDLPKSNVQRRNQEKPDAPQTIKGIKQR